MQLRPPTKVCTQGGVFCVGNIVGRKRQVPTLTACKIGDSTIEQPVGFLFFKVVDVVKLLTRVIVHRKPVKTAAQERVIKISAHGKGVFWRIGQRLTAERTRNNFGIHIRVVRH